MRGPAGIIHRVFAVSAEPPRERRFRESREPPLLDRASVRDLRELCAELGRTRIGEEWR